MCGRYYIDEDDKAVSELIAKIATGPEGDRLLDMKLGEIYPTNTAPVLCAGGARLMQWGFSRYDGNGKVINARSETAMEKPMFQGSMRERRCLLPASGYYEWQRIGKEKRKHAIFMPGGGMLYMAGLFRLEKNVPLPAFVILTRDAAPEITKIHDRMPVILPPEAQAQWLSPSGDARAALEAAVGGLQYRAV